MDIGLFGRGLGIGFAIAAPVGPIGPLCTQRTLNHGRVTGLVSGLGAATADAVYGCIAAFGLMLVSRFLIEHQRWLGIVGGLILCYLAVRTFVTPLWWLLLSGGVSLFRNRIGLEAMCWINRIAGAIIGAFGLYALLGVLV